MNTPGGTEEVDFKSYNGYLQLLIALAALVAIFYIATIVRLGGNVAERAF